MYVIIVAAGSGQRFASDTPKQFLEIAGKLAVQHSIDAFDTLAEVEGIVLVMPKNQKLWKNIKLTSKKPLMYTDGGDNRVLSVLHGLNILESEVKGDTWILVHDAARVCVSTSDIQKLIDTVIENNHGGLLVKPLNDTIKFTEDGIWSEKTIDRKKLRAALTPQMFPYYELKDVLLNTDTSSVTDEASAFEQVGYRPLLIRGRSDNIKITYTEDLLLAEFILRKRQK
jgi:2-C-methyl-D-erythritol 4-phosphate cytidylyltransferase